jgi:hypothetical protein
VQLCFQRTKTLHSEGIAIRMKNGHSFREKLKLTFEGILPTACKNQNKLFYKKLQLKFSKIILILNFTVVLYFIL